MNEQITVNLNNLTEEEREQFDLLLKYLLIILKYQIMIFIGGRDLL